MTKTAAAALPLLATLIATACVGPTPYRPATGSEPGYTETKIENNRYRVTFRGNEATSRETVETYLLYRAAELTLQQGYEWFVVTRSDTQAETDYHAHMAPVFGAPPFGLRGYGYHPFPYYAYGWSWGYAPTYTYDVDRRYEATAYIVMRHGQVPAEEVDAYDASQVQQNLEPRIQRPDD